MNKHLLFSIISIFVFSFFSSAQERFVDPVFDEVTVTSGVVYSDVTNFYMDIYEPTGDTLAERPLLIFAHGGAFIGGDPRTGTSVDVCTQFAQRGYVTASIQYQLADFAAQLIDSVFIMDVVMKAVGDGKAAIRFFNKDADTDNIYRTDATRVFVGGNSAGAILSMHLAYLDEADVLPETLNTLYENNGGFDGNRGNEGYTSDIKGVLNFAGGLNTLSLIDEVSPPTFSAHGDMDGVVPYDCNDVYWGDATIGGLDMVDICGSSEIHPILENLAITNELVTYEGEGHTPWSFDSGMRAELIQMGANFLAPLATPVPVIPSANESELFYNIAVYPNPVKDMLTIDLGNISDLSSALKNVEVSIFDLTGKQVKQLSVDNTNYISLNCGDLQTGIYVLQIGNIQGKISQLIVVE